MTRSATTFPTKKPIPCQNIISESSNRQAAKGRAKAMFPGRQGNCLGRHAEILSNVENKVGYLWEDCHRANKENRPILYLLLK